LGPNTRSSRLALIARHRDPYERRPSAPPPERHIEADDRLRRSAWTAFHRSPLRHHGVGLAVLGYRYRLRLRLGGAAARIARRADGHCAALLHRVAPELALGRLETRAGDLGQRLEFRGSDFRTAAANREVDHRRIRAGRSTSNGHVERLQLTILEECWRPAFARSLIPKKTALERDLDDYLAYSTPTAHTPAVSPTAECPRTSSTVPARWKPPDEAVATTPG
jgi:hypothetical protein